MSYYFLMMLLMNLETKLRNSSVTYVSVIEFSIHAVNFIAIFRATAKILQIYCWGILIRATLYNIKTILSALGGLRRGGGRYFISTLNVMTTAKTFRNHKTKILGDIAIPATVRKRPRNAMTRRKPSLGSAIK